MLTAAVFSLNQDNHCLKNASFNRKAKKHKFEHHFMKDRAVKSIFVLNYPKTAAELATLYNKNHTSIHEDMLM